MRTYCSSNTFTTCNNRWCRTSNPYTIAGTTTTTTLNFTTCNSRWCRTPNHYTIAGTTTATTLNYTICNSRWCRITNPYTIAGTTTTTTLNFTTCNSRWCRTPNLYTMAVITTTTTLSYTTCNSRWCRTLNPYTIAVIYCRWNFIYKSAINKSACFIGSSFNITSINTRSNISFSSNSYISPFSFNNGIKNNTMNIRICLNRNISRKTNNVNIRFGIYLSIINYFTYYNYTISISFWSICDWV